MANNTSSAGDLQELNDRTRSTLLPVLVAIGVMCIVGIIGNILAVYFFGFCAPRRPTIMFITTLAAFDLIISVVSMPLEIFSLIDFYTFPSIPVCKFLRFMNYFASTSSGLLLLSVGVERYRKICQSKFTSNCSACKTIIVTCSLSVILSAPAAVFFTVFGQNITQYNVTGHICTTIRTQTYKLPILIYNGIYVLIFIIAAIVLFKVYFSIYRHIRGRHTVAHRTRYTISMFCISVSYVLSFLPYLTLILWRTSIHNFLPVTLAPSGFAAFEFFIRSYFFNNCTNPIIYGLLNAEFLRYLKNLLSKCLFCRRLCLKRRNIHYEQIRESPAHLQIYYHK